MTTAAEINNNKIKNVRCMEMATRGRLMLMTSLVVSLVVFSPPTANSLSSVGTKSADRLSKNRCGGCLPDQLVGSLKVTVGPEKGNDGKDRGVGGDGLELALDIDLGKGLMLVEPVADIGKKNNDFGRGSCVL